VGKPSIQAVILDWSGTAVDFGCIAPALAIGRALAQCGLELSMDEIRGPMGLHKRDHIRLLMQTPAATEQWNKRHGKPWAEDDVETIYQRSTPLLIDESVRRSAPLPGLLEAVAELRRQSICLGTTTGFSRVVGTAVASAARKQGYQPDVCVFADDVPAARPAPWMIFRAMEQLDVYPPSAVVTVGDTVYDVQAGRHAGAWSVGVLETSSLLGLDEHELAALASSERTRRTQSVEQKLLEAGAHAVIGSVAELPQAVAAIRARLEAGEKP